MIDFEIKCPCFGEAGRKGRNRACQIKYVLRKKLIDLQHEELKALEERKRDKKRYAKTII